MLRERLINCSPGEVQESVVPVLVDAFRHAATPQERLAITRSLGALGPAAREAVPVLAEFLTTTPAPVERQAAPLDGGSSAY